MKIKIYYLMPLLIIFNLNIYSQYLRVPETIQEQDQWCWAAVSSCVLNYYGENISQCTIAEYTREVATWHNFGSVNCCVDPLQGCNYWNYNWGYSGSLQDILQHWGVSNSGIGSALSFSSCQSEVNSSRPFIIRWGWTTGGGHFLVGHGVDVPNTMLYYMNPWFNEGLHISSYSWVVQNSDHIWTHTNTIQTNSQIPNVPVLALPLNNSLNQPTTLFLLWRKCDRVTTYKVQVSTDNSFSSTVVNDSTLTDTIKTVSSLLTSKKYYWRVRAKNSIGNSSYSNVWNFTTSPTGVKQISNEVPLECSLFQNYPNPFNPTTKMKFSLPHSSEGVEMLVNLRIYDMLGREVATLLNEKLQPGTYEVEWSATGGASNYPNGVYFYKLTTGDFTAVKKLVLLK